LLLAVVLPWALSRGALLLVVLYAGVVNGSGFGETFTSWDGGWYIRIAKQGYGFQSRFGESPYAFFPLLPWLLHGGAELGIRHGAVGLGLTQVAFLLALYGVYDIARAHGSPREAALASWFLAFYPGTAAMALIYPDAIYLALAVWSFRALEHRRDGIAAVLAAAAALVRPNGSIVAASLAVGAARRGSWRRALLVAAPAAAGVGAWMLWLWWRTGDALVFVHAKDVWHEVTAAAMLAGRDAVPKIDLAALVFALAVIASAWRRLPLEWLLFAALALLPSLAFGIQGMPRYSANCFPLSVAAGILLARLPAAARYTALAVMAAGLLWFARQILLGGQLP
jgi:hypothetical protein